MTLELWQDALSAVAVAAVDPIAVGGICVRARAGPVRSFLVQSLRERIGVDKPWRRLPAHVTEDRLLGGLDLSATLRAGQVVVERGVLASAHGGVVAIPMAERIPARIVAQLTSAMDSGEVVLERDGVGRRLPSRFGVCALDEGIDDERVAGALRERLGIHIDVDTVPPRWTEDFEPSHDAAEVEAARVLRPQVRIGDDLLEALCRAATVLGVASLRSSILAVEVARSAAALEGRSEPNEEDASLAARLVLAPRATRVPSSEPEAEEAPPPEPPPPPQGDEPGDDDALDEIPSLDEILVAAAESAIPSGLLAQLGSAQRAARAANSDGPSGALRASMLRGRPTGSRAGDLSKGTLNLVETLRAAAPWQPLRKAKTGREALQVRQEDFRIRRFKRRSESLTVFCVDASGSSALQRLGEAKGAVEHVLAECYSRRDNVALVAFRGQEANLLVPPTKSLVRAKRCLAELPGGGATPIAAGLESALRVAEDGARRGQTPVLVVMTDGRANVDRDGEPDRQKGREDALAAARSLREAGYASLFVDTSPRPRPVARELAEVMGASYIALPHARGTALPEAIRRAAGSGT